MSTRKPSVTAQESSKSRKPKLTDLAPKLRAGEQLKGGPQGNPWARIKGKKPGSRS